MSNWESAPLTPAQVSYATDDAWVGVLVHEFLESTASIPDALSLSSLPTVPEDGEPEYSPAGTSVLPPSPRMTDRQSPSERLDTAVVISNEGNELDSEWLQSPPVADIDFLTRLNKEKMRRFFLAFIKLDPFHWMDRYSRVLPKNHVLFPIFMSCLRDALFHLDQGDVALQREKMIQKGMDPGDAARVPKSFFTRRGRCRRSIPQRLELEVRVQANFELFYTFMHYYWQLNFKFCRNFKKMI